ncbi:MAG: DUF1569 domain-containing protein [Phycisphaerales bacterium]
MQRPLKLDTWDGTVSECRLLLETGYERKGYWTLAQVRHHLRLTIKANMISPLPQRHGQMAPLPASAEHQQDQATHQESWKWGERTPIDSL